jgi:hypothetical protein
VYCSTGISIRSFIAGQAGAGIPATGTRKTLAH